MGVTNSEVITATAKTCQSRPRQFPMILCKQETRMQAVQPTFSVIPVILRAIAKHDVSGFPIGNWFPEIAEITDFPHPWNSKAVR